MTAEDPLGLVTSNGYGHVRGIGRVTQPHVAAYVRRDARIAMKNFYDRGRAPRPHFFFCEPVRRGVTVFADLHVIVEPDAPMAPLAVLETLWR